MPSLKELLQQYTTENQGFTLGAKNEQDDNARSTLLRQQLARINDRNNRLFWICAGMALLIFAGAVWFVFQNLSSPEKLQAVFGASGISLGGILYYMHQLWKEKNTAEIITILLGSVNNDQLNTVLTVLLAKM